MPQIEGLFNRSDFLNNAMNVARMIASHCVAEGDTAVDATAGNGHDTLMLARLVGEAGRVVAFDVQGSAVEKTWALLATHGLSDRVTLVTDSHTQMGKHVTGPVSCVMFNLGFLPGSDKTCTTKAESTLAASTVALSLLALRGCVLWVVYPGHDGGGEERALSKFVADLDPKEFNLFSWRPMNQTGHPPFLLGAQKRA